MRLGRCPLCHGHLQLEAVVQDEAARAMLALLHGLPGGLGQALVSYLGLFRPERYDLTWERALRLAHEALAMEADHARLAWALAETVERIRAKGESRRMTNHNYLRKVLEGAPAAAGLAERLPGPAVGAPTRTMQAMMGFMGVGDGQEHD